MLSWGCPAVSYTRISLNPNYGWSNKLGMLRNGRQVETVMRSAFGRVIPLKGDGIGWVNEPRIAVPPRQHEDVRTFEDKSIIHIAA